MDHGKTIRQIAEELGVSKQAVHQKRKGKGLETALQPFTTTIDGTVYISPEGEALLKQAFIKPETPTPSTVNVNGFTPVDGNEHPLYAILKAELEAKNRQLEAKDKQIEQLQGELADERKHSRELTDRVAVLAEQAQALHAGTIKTQLPPAGEEQPIEVDADPAQKEPEQKKGFWSWLTGR